MSSSARPRRARAIVAAAATLAIIASGLVASSAGATIAQSQIFDGWGSWAEGGADVTFSADTSIVHDGTQSLRVTNVTPLAPGAYGAISQGLAVSPSTTYQLSVWVRADSVAEGAGFIVYNGGPTSRMTVPGGTYDWQQLQWEYTTGATETVIPFILATQDVGTLWFDDVQVAAAGGVSVVANGGFETSRNTIAIGVADLFFDEGAAVIPLGSTSSSVDYIVSDIDGTTITSGAVDTSTGQGDLNLSGLGAGYYSLALTAPGASRDTTFAVIAGSGTPLDPDETRFGTTMHPMTHPGLDQSTMVSELGLGRIRLDWRWEAIETTPGVYNWDAGTLAEVDRLIALGIKPTLIAAYYGPYDDGRTPSSPEGIAGYANFLRATAELYGDAVDYEIYNEFNIGYSNGACGRSPECYLQLLAPAANAIHEVAPEAIVIGPVLGALTPMWLTTNEAYDWLARFFELGGLDYIDVVSIHNYAAPNPPEGHNDAVIERVRALMATYPAAEDMPLWLTETGYSTIGVTAGGNSEQQQAAYLVRDAAGVLSAGADMYMVYDMLDDWDDPYNPEANFGLVRNPSSQLGTLAPKPAFVSMAVLTHQLAGLDPVTADDTADGVHSYLFSDGNGREVRVMWSTVPTTIGASASAPVAVTGYLGNSGTINPESGRITVHLDGNPVYLTSEEPISVDANNGPVAVTVPASVLQNIEFDIIARVDNRGDSSASTMPVTFRHESGAEVTVDSVPGELREAVLTIPALEGTGPQPVTVTVRRGSTDLGLRTGVTAVQENPVATLVPVAVAGRATSLHAALAVSYQGADPSVTVSGARWSIGTQSGEVTTSAALDSSGTAHIILPVDAVPLWSPESYEVTLTLSDGVEKMITGTTAFAPAVPEGSTPAPSADLATVGEWVGLGGEYAGAEDLSGTMWLSWSDAGVTVHASVIDDVHVVAATAETLWAADSIQFGFAPGWPDLTSSREFGAALLATGPVVFDFTGAGALVPEATAVVTRDESTHTTDYAVTLPWSVVGIEPTEDYLGYSFLVNDHDGAGRTGFMEWGSGIGRGKGVDKYVPVQLVPAAVNPISVSAVATSFCLASRPRVAVLALNSGVSAVSVTLATPFASSAFGLSPQWGFALRVLTAPGTSLAAGAATITANSTMAGVASSRTVAADYAGIDCRKKK